jgi:uncharacterized membrane protein YfcA
MSVDLVLFLAVGSFLGGLVNGLTGFGFALIALPIWAFTIDPKLAVPLAACGGILGQLQTVHKVFPDAQKKDLLPLLVGGLVGVPLGTTLLVSIDVPTFRATVGAILLAYCCFSIANFGRFRVEEASWLMHSMVGLGGGVMGGLAALSGPLPIIWSALQGWRKEQRRAYIQLFNLVILTATVLSAWGFGAVGSDLLLALLITVPGALIGVQSGFFAYRRLDASGYDRAVTWVLMASGFALVWPVISALGTDLGPGLMD